MGSKDKGGKATKKEGKGLKEKRAELIESAVANRVTSIPLRTSPSVRSDENCSQGP